MPDLVNDLQQHDGVSSLELSQWKYGESQPTCNQLGTTESCKQHKAN